MHRTLTLVIATFLAAVAVACGGAQGPAAAAAGAADCKQPAAGAKTCDEGCNWDATASACMPTRGVIIENKPAPVATPTSTTVVPAPTSTTVTAPSRP
jgi:hypothetical protein